MTTITLEDLSWLLKASHKASNRYSSALKTFQEECPHPEVLHWEDKKRYFNGYSYSGPRAWVCTRCKLNHYFSSGWADHKLMTLPKRVVTHDEYTKALSGIEWKQQIEKQ